VAGQPLPRNRKNSLVVSADPKARTYGDDHLTNAEHQIDQKRFTIQKVAADWDQK